MKINKNDLNEPNKMFICLYLHFQGVFFFLMLHGTITNQQMNLFELIIHKYSVFMSINFSRNSITASRTFVLIIYSMLSSRLNKHKKTKQHLIPISKNRASVFGGSEQDQCSLNMINYYLI